jgi:hypothetical protein
LDSLTKRHAPAMHAIGHEAGERAQHPQRGGAGERGQPHHEGRVGELEREPAEQDEIHPARPVDAEAREPEAAVGRSRRTDANAWGAASAAAVGEGTGALDY